MGNDPFSAHSEIVIGVDGGGLPVKLDLDHLFETGLLVQAASGGGKSYLMRRLAEQLCTRVPTHIIDPEGEFFSLREKFDFVLVKRSGGDLMADPDTAGALALELRRLRASVVFDLFDLNPRQRHLWVRNYLSALDSAPRDTWDDLAILIDESHVFAPEKGHGESEALEAMAALVSRGRKRGLLTIAATQRLAKMSKDVAAELKNVIVGLTVIDIDRARARDALGVDKPDRRAMDQIMRHLKPGNFLGLGRAFGIDDRVSFKGGHVLTTHPERGARRRLGSAPPPPKKILEMLSLLGDLKQASIKAMDADQLRAENSKLRAQLAAAPADNGNEFRAAEARWTEIIEQQRGEIAKLQSDLAHERKFCAEAGGAVTSIRDGAQALLAQIHEKMRELGSMALAPPPAPRTFFLNERQEIPGNGKPAPGRRAAAAAAAGDEMPGALRRILTAMAQCGPRLTRRKLSILTGYPPGGSSIRNNVAIGRARGWIDDVSGSDDLAITVAGREALGTFEPLPTGRALLDYWEKELPAAAWSILNLAIGAYPQAVGRDRIAQATGYPAGGSSIRNNLGTLRGLELVEYTQGGAVMAAADLFGGARS